MESKSTHSTGCILFFLIFYLLFSIELFAQINGTHYIGTGQEYITIQEAIDSIESQGVDGPVIMKIKTDNYHEQLRIDAIPGVSATNTVIFESETQDPEDVLIYWDASTSSNNYVVLLSNCSYITLQYLKIVNSTLTSNYCKVISFDGNVTYNNIKYNKLIGKSTTSTTADLAIIYSYRDVLNYTEITNNEISSGTFPIYFDGYTSDYSTGVKFNYNICNSYRGANFEEQDKIEVIGNEINSDYDIGLNLTNCREDIKVLFNRINSNYSSGHSGLYLNNTDGSLAFQGLIANNVIYVSGNGDWAEANLGINCNDVAYQRFFHNTVLVNEGNGSTFAFWANVGNNIVLKNNNFTTNNGYAYGSSNGTNISESDYNNYFTWGNYLAQWNGGSLNNISALQTANGKDANSLSISPSYKSISSELKPQTHWLNNTGTDLTSTIAYDIDSIARTTSPDIGAYEFIPSNTNTYNGNLTIKPLGGGTFISFSEAIDSLQKLGISGPVTIDIDDGTYNINKFITEIPGSSATNTITFQSASVDSSKVTFTYSSTSTSDNFVLDITNTDYLAFKHMTFENTGATYGRIIRLFGNAHHLSFENNIFKGSGNAADTYDRSIVFSNGQNTDDLTFINNSFSAGDRSLYLVGTSTTDNVQSLLISNNVFSGAYLNIYLSNYQNFDINGNSFSNFSWAGIGISACNSPYTIRNNIITSTSTSNYGISIHSSNGTGIGGLVYNNFIHVQSSSNIAGIRIYNSSYQSIYHNSVNLISTNSSSKALYYDYYSAASNVIIKNNNLIVDGPGYPFYLESASSVISASDYNNLYTGGSYIVFWENTSYTDLASYQAATGKDLNSVNYDPGFSTNSDLHTNSYWLDGVGTPIAGVVTTDIDGDPRDVSNPDIGADEYTSTLIPYHGEYFIGTGQRFESFTEAIDSLVERGIIDSVVFKVMNGYYNEQFVIPQISGVSNDALIIFESNSGTASDVVITFDPTIANNYIVKFEGTDYVTFKNISFQSGTTTYARIFVFEGKCEYNTFIGNNIQGRSESTNSDIDAIFYARENNPIINNFIISNNIISNGSFGILFENLSSSPGIAFEIFDNIFNTSYQGLYIKYFVAPKIESNSISFNRDDGIGINIQNCTSAATYGTIIRNNTIVANFYTYTNGAVYIANCDANSSFPGLISNNVIRVGVNNSYRSIGFYVIGSDYLNFYHNSINLNSNQSNDLAFYSTTSNYLNIVNNNFVIKGNIGDKTAAYGYAYYIKDGTINNSDYNNYYSPGKYLAYWAGSSYGTLGELQAANGKDVHSVSYFPAFRSTTDLKTNSQWLDNKGTPLTSVSEDIDGVTRNITNPDIGAYEYTSTLTPIASGTYSVGFGGNFPTIDSLANSLLERGISGSAFFNLIQGSYSNTNLSLKDIPGTSATDTVVIQSQSGDPGNTVISCNQGSTNNYILKLNGTDYLTIRNLSFSSGGTNYTCILNIDGNTKNINIIDNELNGVSSVSDDYNNKSLIYVSTEQIVDNLIIQGNTFLNNSYGIYFGGFINYNHSNIKVINNDFSGQYKQMYFYRTKKVYIEGNELNGGLERGIELHECDDDIKIINNKVFSSADIFYGIFLNYCDGTTANKGLIANNFVKCYGISGAGSYGIKLDYSNYQQIYFNSSKITGSVGAALHCYYGGNIELVNNIYANNGSTTYTYNTQNATAVTFSNYNDFYSTGTKYIRYNNTDYATLAAYKATSLMDNNSLSVNPVFTGDTDFHLLSDSVVGKAIVITDVTTDIDGELRDISTPDIGADEFSCQFFPSPVITNATACSNDSIPNLYAEGTNIKWYSDRDLTNEIWSANEYNPGISAPGVYTYYVTQTLGECTSSVDSAVLTILAAPELNADITHIDCQGTNYGTINLTVTGSTGPYNYLWSNDKITEDISGLAAGDYIVQVEDIKGCTEIDTFTITSPSEIILDIITEDTECDTSFGEATVVASGGETPYSYLWSNGEVGTVIDSLYAGIYTVTVTDNRGCSKFAIATVSDIGAPEILVNSVIDISCYGGSNGAINLSVSGGTTPYTYLWSNGATTEDISTLLAGSYELIVVGNNGCQSIVSVDVNEPDPIKISLNITETSCGQSNGAAEAIINGGTSPYSFLWSTGSTNDEITGLDLGVYDIEVTDNNGCSALKYFSVSEIGSPSIIVDSIFEGTCGNSDGAIYISVYGAYSTYSYLWSNSAETEDLIGVIPDTYYVEVSDSGGCNAILVSTIEANKPEPNPICMVTVNTDTHFNEIIWEKNYTENVHHYNIYKEGSQSGVYSLIGNVPADQESVFIDENSDVMQRAWRYKISVVDSCGVESDLSDHHKTMHLTMNLGINNSINLIWDHYEGFDFDTYYIHRRSDSGWELLDSVPNNLTSYTDSDPILDEYLYYMIEIKHPYGCNPTKASRNTSRSNVSRGTVANSVDTQAPIAPALLATTEITDTTISIIWWQSDDNFGVTAYLVYKNDDFLEEVTDTTYKAIGLTKLTTYSFYVKATDAAGNISESSNVISPTTTGSTDIKVVSKQDQIKVYPNPNAGSFIIEIESINEQDFWYSIYTINGQLINREHIGNVSGKIKKSINLLHLQNSIYFIKIEYGTNTLYEKIVIYK